MDAIIDAKKVSAMPQYNRRRDLRGILDKIVSVTDLGKGKASKILQQIKDDQEPFIIVKNNRPEAVILSIKEYDELMEQQEDLELLTMAVNRMKEYDSSDTLSHNEVLKMFNLTDEELDRSKDTVEIE